MTLAGFNAIHATILVGVPTAVLLVFGLLVRDARDVGRRPGPRRARRVPDLILLMLAAVFVLVLIARFVLLT
jgi:hypothetical protein